MLQGCYKYDIVCLISDWIKTYWKKKATCYVNVDNFRPYLNAGKRELLADYSLPVAVVIMSFFGSYIFRDVQCKWILSYKIYQIL